MLCTHASLTSGKEAKNVRVLRQRQRQGYRIRELQSCLKELQQNYFHTVYIGVDLYVKHLWFSGLTKGYFISFLGTVQPSILVLCMALLQRLLRNPGSCLWLHLTPKPSKHFASSCRESYQRLLGCRKVSISHLCLHSTGRNWAHYLPNFLGEVRKYSLTVCPKGSWPWWTHSSLQKPINS